MLLPEVRKPRLRDELLDGEIIYPLRVAQIVIESWQRYYNSIRRAPAVAPGPLA
jgi:hypothetical protein